MENNNDELYDILIKRGFESSLSHEIAYKYLITDYTRTRMIGYLYRMTDITEEMLIDEMLAILEDRNALIKKHEMEKAQSTINKIYNEGLD